MLTDRVSRRGVLAGAGAVAAGTLILPGAPASASEDHENGLLGSWLVTRTDVPPGPTVQSIQTFAGGGAFINRDYNPPGAPGLGTWAKTGHNRFVVTVLSGQFGPTPGEVALVKANATGTFNDEHISGTFSVTVTNGKGVLLASGTGTFEGSRINATGPAPQ
jgi:hypothetical protein